jgi:hypothetical protein
MTAVAFSIANAALDILRKFAPVPSLQRATSSPSPSQLRERKVGTGLRNTIWISRSLLGALRLPDFIDRLMHPHIVTSFAQADRGTAASFRDHIIGAHVERYHPIINQQPRGC